MQSSSLRFAGTVQSLAAAARSLGLLVPGFRTPPRLVGVHRSIRRWAGGATVAVVVRGRPWPAVQADMIEGIVAANRLASPAADRARHVLWAAVGAEVAPAAVERPAAARRAPRGRPSERSRSVHAAQRNRAAPVPGGEGPLAQGDGPVRAA